MAQCAICRNVSTRALQEMFQCSMYRFVASRRLQHCRLCRLCRDRTKIWRCESVTLHSGVLSGIALVESREASRFSSCNNTDDSLHARHAVRPTLDLPMEDIVADGSMTCSKARNNMEVLVCMRPDNEPAVPTFLCSSAKDPTTRRPRSMFAAGRHRILRFESKHIALRFPGQFCKLHRLQSWKRGCPTGTEMHYAHFPRPICIFDVARTCLVLVDAFQHHLRTA